MLLLSRALCEGNSADAIFEFALTIFAIARQYLVSNNLTSSLWNRVQCQIRDFKVVITEKTWFCGESVDKLLVEDLVLPRAVVKSD